MKLNREQQLEEISNEIYETLMLEADCPLSGVDCAIIADLLIKKGYRKASEVARECFSDFESILFSIMYFGCDGKYHLRKMSADKATLIFEKCFELKKKYKEEGK